MLNGQKLVENRSKVLKDTTLHKNGRKCEKYGSKHIKKNGKVGEK
jgi:hypothetical protein